MEKRNYECLRILQREAVNLIGSVDYQSIEDPRDPFELKSNYVLQAYLVCFLDYIMKTVLIRDLVLYFSIELLN